MASPASPVPQEFAAPVPSNGASEKRSTPATPLEASKEITAIEEAVPSLANKETGNQPVTKAMRRKAWIQFATLCWSIFVVGWNDGTTGPLVPRLQEVYHVRSISYHRVKMESLLKHRFQGIVRCRVCHFHRQLCCMSATAGPSSTAGGYSSARPFQGFISGATSYIYVTDRFGFGLVPLRLR